MLLGSTLTSPSLTTTHVTWRHLSFHLPQFGWPVFQGEADNLPEILKMAVLALHPDAPDMRVAALAASKVVAENGANKGDHPAVIRKDHGMIWNDMERDGKAKDRSDVMRWMDESVAFFSANHLNHEKGFPMISSPFWSSFLKGQSSLLNLKDTQLLDKHFSPAANSSSHWL